MKKVEYSFTDEVIIAQPKEVPMLLQLYKIWENSLSFIVELEYLQDFKEVVPGVFNPRRIIEYMKETHRLHASVLKKHPNFVQRIIFGYTDMTRTIKMEFSDNMSFRNDVVIICFLYDTVKFFMHTCPEHRLIPKLMQIMVDKYRIKDSTINFDPNNITLFNMWYSFPSISMDLYGHYDNFLQRVAPLFPNTNLPNIMFLTVFERIWRILPKLSNPPIATLIHIFLKMNLFYSKNTLEGSLARVYSTILDNYNSTDFPEKLKIFICQRWNIVTLDGEPQFNPCFMSHYNQAKREIRILRKQELAINKVGVENILSKI